MRLCTLCCRTAKGLYYTHLHRPEFYPTYSFCSVRCLRAGAAIAKRNLGMIDKTKLHSAGTNGQPYLGKGAVRDEIADRRHLRLGGH
jgi:hypothetical protein